MWVELDNVHTDWSDEKFFILLNTRDVLWIRTFWDGSVKKFKVVMRDNNRPSIIISNGQYYELRDKLVEEETEMRHNSIEVESGNDFATN